MRLLEEAENDETSETKGFAQQDVGRKCQNCRCVKTQRSHALHHRHLAFHHLWSRAMRLVNHIFETLSRHGSRMLGCVGLSSLPPPPPLRKKHGTTATPSHRSTPLFFCVGGSFSGDENRELHKVVQKAWMRMLLV